MTGSQSAAARGDVTHRRRLLLVTRDFPPANSSAALRAVKQVRHLAQHGWDCTVVTIHPSFHRSVDPDLRRNLPPRCSVHYAFGFDTKEVLAVRGRYPRLLATPDRSASWFPHAVLTCLRVARAHSAQAILTTSPPVTAHCVGWAVRRLSKLPWAAELRDPWNMDPLGPLSGLLDRRLERRVLRAADQIIVTTQALRADLEHRVLSSPVEKRIAGSERHATPTKIAVLPNSYDDDDFAVPAPPNTPAFCIAHVGHCLPERDPLPVLGALRLALQRETLPPETQLLFIGAGTGFPASIDAEVQRLGLSGNIQITERVPHALAVQRMRAASVLLLLQTRPQHRYCIPAKAYEYLRSQACIVAVAPGDSATALELSGIPGVLHAPVDQEQIAQRLAAAFRLWQAAGEELRFHRRLEAYSGRRIAGQLATLLNRLSPDSVAPREAAIA